MKMNMKNNVNFYYEFYVQEQLQPLIDRIEALEKNASVAIKTVDQPVGWTFKAAVTQDVKPEDKIEEDKIITQVEYHSHVSIPTVEWIELKEIITLLLHDGELCADEKSHVQYSKNLVKAVCEDIKKLASKSKNPNIGGLRKN